MSSVPASARRVLPGLPSLSGLYTSIGEDPAGDARVELVVEDRCQLDVVGRAAVEITDDHVLRDVDEAPRQVPRVGGAQSGVGEALAGTVRRDEVLEHRQAFHEVGLDRALDDLALRIRHQAAHAGELADLVERSAGTGVGHHEDRVRLVEVVLHRLGDFLRRLGPDRHDALVRSSSVIRPRWYSPSSFRTWAS